MSRGIYDSVNKVRIPTCGREDFNVDNELLPGSQNAVENRVITAAINKKYDIDDTAETDLANGDYIPFYDTSATAKRKTLWSNVITKIKAALSTVATSGSYDDLSNKPTIPGLQDVLTSASTTDALTANMGKTLAEGISNLSSSVNNIDSKYTSNSVAWQSRVDLNNYTRSGLYPMGNNLTNAPASWGMLFVMAPRKDTINQMFMSYPNMFIREYRNSAWTSWKQITAT